MKHLTFQLHRDGTPFSTARPVWRHLAFWMTLLVMLAGACGTAWAQDNATITGTVLDSTGAVVPSAQISLTNPATGQVRQGVSNSAGAYRFANVGVGTYTLSAAASGFQKYTKTDIVVNVAQTLEEDISLAVGNQTETVTVAAEALQVQSETS